MESFYLIVDGFALFAVASMLYITECQRMDQPTPPTIEQRIHAMLDDAITNGYDISEWTTDDIVADLLAFADLNEDEGEDTIRPHVLTWKSKRTQPT